LEYLLWDADDILFELILCPNQPLLYPEPWVCFWMCQYLGTYVVSISNNRDSDSDSLAVFEWMENNSRKDIRIVGMFAGMGSGNNSFPSVYSLSCL